LGLPLPYPVWCAGSPDGFAAETLRLAGANVEAVLDGRATRETADLGLRVIVPELRRLDPRISSGRAHVQARLTGSLERPDAVATATLEDVRALDRSISRFVVDLKGRDLTGALDATLRVDGDVAGKRAVGTLHLVRPADGSMLLDHLDLSVGSVSLKGGLRVSARGLAQGDVLLAAGNLDDVSPLALTRLGGSINANVVLSAENDAQAANITAEGSHLQLGAARLADLKAALAGRDLLHRPSIDGKVEAGALTVGGQTFRQVRLTADGAPDRTRFALTAAAQGFALETTGRLVPAADSNSIELTAFEARRGSKRIMLASPTTIIVAPDATRISDLALLVDGGRLLVSGQVGGTLDLSLQAARVPLSAADIVVPGLGLSGSLDGRLMLQGTTALPTGSYEITLSQLASQPLRDAGLRAVNVRAAGQLADARASVQATIDATQAGQLRIVGSVPLGTNGILDLTVGGRLDLRAMNGALSASGQRIAGTTDVDLRVRGTGLAPVAEGSMTLSGGTFEDPIQGVRLTAIEGRLVAKGTMVQLERLTAQTPPGGSLAATGRITLDPAAGLPADIHITGTRAQLATNATTTAVADLNLSLRGPLLRQPQLGGRIDLVSLDVTVPDRLPVTLRPLPADKARATPSRCGGSACCRSSASGIEPSSQVHWSGSGSDHHGAEPDLCARAWHRSGAWRRPTTDRNQRSTDCRWRL
jgi:translocation and assembly module TamB